VHDGAEGRRPAGPGGSTADRRARAVQLVLAIALIGTAAVGLRAAAAMNWHFAQGPAGRQRPVTAGLAAVLAVLLVALLVLRARRPNPGQPAAVLRSALTLIVSLSLVALAIAFVISLLESRSSHKLPPSLQPTPSPSPSATPPLRGLKYGHTAQGGGDLGTLLIYAVLGTLFVVVILALLSLLRRHRAMIPEAPEPEPDDEAALRDAVQAGQAALREYSDARKAIIACYAAMERGLSRAGAERGAAETPDELLARVSASGIVQGRAAERLTRLFYEARYSEHDMPDAARQAAQHSLQDIELELDHRRRHVVAGAAP
jgi:Domain of unknown function (DUF4129)